ncbi:MAG: RNA polymerase sigma factor [Armatimonadota bacterium]|nr:RNA polymerase sigma factor [Armatimonadota bacterium]
MESVGDLLTIPDTVRLAEAAAAGDAEAFDLLMKRYGDHVFRLALRMLGNREDAEDIQQEAFVRAYRKLHTFRGDGSFGNWIYAVTVRLCLSRKRRSAAKRVEVRKPPGVLRDGDHDPQERLAAAEAAARVQQTLDRLSAPDRLLILLKYVEDLSHEEIARILRCSVQSSRSRLARAKRLFREQYEKEG